MRINVFSTSSFTIYLTDQNSYDINEIMEFVVRENYLHHLKKLPKELSLEVSEIVKEEKRLSSTSYFFIALDPLGQVLGCIRLNRWDCKTDLPIIKMGVDINTLSIINKHSNIWHIGRFAVTQGEIKDRVVLFKALIICAISPIVKTPDSVMVAEMDSKLLNSLRRMGIDIVELGPPEFYLGSKTIPVYATSAGLSYFYNSNSWMIDRLT